MTSTVLVILVFSFSSLTCCLANRGPVERCHNLSKQLSNGKLPVYCTDNQILSYPHITSFDFEFFFKPEAKNIPIQATNGTYCPIIQTRWVLSYYTVLLMLKSWQLIANQIRKLVSCIQWNLLWNTSIQGTTPLRGHKIWSRKNAHIIFVSITSIDGTPLLTGHLGIQNTSNQKEDWYLYTM